MNGKDLRKIFESNGWILDRIRGSHHIMVKDGRRAIPIPTHGNKDIPKGLANKILKQACIKGVRI